MKDLQISGSPKADNRCGRRYLLDSEHLHSIDVELVGTVLHALYLLTYPTSQVRNLGLEKFCTLYRITQLAMVYELLRARIHTRPLGSRIHT